ncbi:MAG TPA: hypothetical protein VFT37_05580 [Telluria sp.]|nr:hypothetical protein [Telluria sp.]
MKNEAITVEVPPLLYLDLGAYLRQTGDTRTPGYLVAAALKAWQVNPAADRRQRTRRCSD